MSTGENRGPILPLVVLVAVAFLVAGVVWLLSRGGDEAAGLQRAGATTTGAAVAPGARSGSEQLALETAPRDGFALPEGQSRSDGYSVKFPYSDLGAVAMDVQVARSQVGFDYDQAAVIAVVYAAPEDRAVFERRSRDAVALRRRQAGVPAQGEVPAPASYAATPIAFTVQQLGTDHYVVNLLSYITLTTADGNSADALYAGTQLVRWIDGDWKLIRGTDAELEQLVNGGQPQAAAPGTPEYENAGWIALNGEPR